MNMDRRTFLSLSAALLSSSSMAQPGAIQAVVDYERTTGGHIGLFAKNIRTGATLAWRADERFVMCSTFKASLAACILSRVDQGTASLDSRVPFGPSDIQGDWWAPVARDNLSKGELSVRELCAAVVEQSDNTCANLLLARIGGPAALTAYWRQLGDSVSRLDDDEPLLNRTPPGKQESTTTPAAMAGTLRRLTLGDALSSASRTQLVEWLVGCQTGFNRLRAGLPKDWRTGDKTGNNGADAAGDLLITWPQADVPMLACVYTRGGSPTPAQLERVFGQIGHLVADRLYRP